MKKVHAEFHSIADAFQTFLRAPVCEEVSTVFTMTSRCVNIFPRTIKEKQSLESLCDLCEFRSTLDVTTVDTLMRISLNGRPPADFHSSLAVARCFTLGRGLSGHLSCINLTINFLPKSKTIYVNRISEPCS